jgi:cell division septation protein DedD
LTAHTPDDGFHEIQLNGKQLVFLFMAATVVSVVIFLCGVLVGRDVRAERSVTSLDDVPAATATSVSSDIPDSDPRVAAPPPAVDELSYFNRLEKPQPGTEDLKPAATTEARPLAPAVVRPKPAPVAAATPPQVAAAEKAAPPAAPRPVPSEARPGFAVQLAALNSQAEADAMVKRLTAKGYGAYVVTPTGGAPSIFRVRVGNFDTRREADTIAAKLEKEGQFKPWVTR